MPLDADPQPPAAVVIRPRFGKPTPTAPRSAARSENRLTDAQVRTADVQVVGPYLADGGGLRVRLLPPSKRTPKGARLFEFHFKLDGKNGALHLGTYGEPFTDAKGATRRFGLADARAARDAARILVAQRIDPREAGRLAKLEAAEAQRVRLAELDSRRTVRQAFNQWRELYLSAHRKDGGQYVADIFERHLFPALGERPLEEVRRRDVTGLLDKLTAAGKRRTANTLLSALRQFVRWCAVREWLERDPTLGISKRDAGGLEQARERNLTEAELGELHRKMTAARMPERLRLAVWVLLATGVRVGELSGARRDEFDFAAGEWRIPGERMKNGEPHTVPLSEFALEKLRALDDLAGPSAWMLPARDPRECIGPKLIAKMLNDRQRPVPLKGRSKQAGALMLAGGKWTPHDLRRTMASRMGDLGVRPDVIERCLGHKPEGIVAVYQRAELIAERREAFERWGERLAAIVAGSAS